MKPLEGMSKVSGMQRFLSRREKKPKTNGEIPDHTHPHRILHTVSDEKRKTDREEEKKVKEILQRLNAENVATVKEAQVEDVLRLPSINGSIEAAMSLLRLFDDAAHGRILVTNPLTKLVGAVNRENVTCYLDSLLFSMFSRTESFEGVLSADFPDNPRKRLVTLLRLWVNMLRSGKLITTDITQKLQESLRDCGWSEAALLRQQDVSEAFTFITGKLDLPLLTLKMDVYHTGKEDKDDHRIVRERLLDVAIPEPPADGSIIRLEDCLEQYFNNKIEVKRHLQRRNTVQSFRPGEKPLSDKGMDVETVEVAESPATHNMADPFIQRPVDTRRRGDSIFGQRRTASMEKGELSERRTHDDIALHGNRQRVGTARREVLMPAWQFFSLIPWYTHDHTKHLKSDKQIVVHLQTKRPVLGICLKRYSMTNAGVGTRLDTYIDIPLEIGVPHFISDDCGHDSAGFEPNFTNFKLSLQAVICHRGKSLDAGHYIALVRDHDPQPSDDVNGAQWLRFDDLASERIVTVDIHKALKDECPYLLFYQVRPVDDDTETESRGDPPTYDEATTDHSNELSRVTTKTEIGDTTTDSSPAALPSHLSVETLDSTDIVTIPASATADMAVAQVINAEVAPEALKAVVSDPGLHARTSSANNLDVKAMENVRPSSIDIAGLAPSANANKSKASLEVPRGKESLESNRRSSVAFTGSDKEESSKGGTSAPITPGDDNRRSFFDASRRNSIAKGWLGTKSRPPSQVGDNRLSMSQKLKNAMSKDKINDTTVGEAPDEAPLAVDGIAEKNSRIGRSKSLRHKRGKGSGSHKQKRSSSLGKKLDMNGDEKPKKVPDRECILM